MRKVLLISVKHIKETKYPESVTVKVKGYFKDLLDTVDCYKKSKLKKSFIAKHIGCKTLNEIPVLFYISSHKDDSEHSNYIEKIKSTSFLSDHDVRELYVIDNNKLTFILNSLDYIKNKKSDYEWFFYSPYTGMNIADPQKRYSKVLQVEFIASKFIPFLLRKKTIDGFIFEFLIISSENFSEQMFTQYVSYARQQVGDVISSIEVSTPDFYMDDHTEDLRKVRSQLSLDIDLTASNFIPNFRNLSNE